MQRQLLCAAGALLFATSASAQAARPAQPAPAARPATAPANPGPAIAGVCILDGAGAITGSSAGRAASTRLQTLTQQVQAELQGLETPLTTEANAIRALPEAQRAARAQALQTRVNAFRTTAQTRQEELQRTQARALQRIEAELQTVVSTLYTQRNCGLMLDRSAVVYSNPAMDVTQAAVTALNARLPTITFERERLPATPAPAAR